MKLLTLLITGVLGLCTLSAAPADTKTELTRPQAIAKLKEMRIEKQLLETAGLDKPKQETNRKSLADAIDEAIGDDFGF